MAERNSSDTNGAVAAEHQGRPTPAEVGAEIARVFASQSFSQATRCREFLHFVVTSALQGCEDQLKERCIGIEVFGRSPGYSTGDDPVVRVKAGEVRRRLAQYYAQEGRNSSLRIELPVGSYRPEFLRASESEEMPPEAVAQPTSNLPGDLPVPAPTSLENPPAGSPAFAEDGRQAVIASSAGAKAARFSTSLGLFATAAVFLCLGALAAWLLAWQAQQAPRAVRQFWGPALDSPKGVVIYVPSPITYQPNMQLYEKAGADPRFQTLLGRTRNLLKFPPGQMVPWNEIWPFPHFYVAAADARAAITLEKEFSALHKRVVMRLGERCTFDDLRGAPAVLVGGLDNRWSMRRNSELPIRFVESPTDQEQLVDVTGPQHRSWGQKWEQLQQNEDVGIIARLQQGAMGGFQVIVAGLSPNSNEAAANMISDPKQLARLLAQAPPGWQHKNLEIVFGTNVVEYGTGSSRLITERIW